MPNLHRESLTGPRNVSVDLKYDLLLLVSVCVLHTHLSLEK